MVKEAKEIINNADVVIITSGAGMGVDSGLPDFRGDEGMWGEYPILKDLNISFSTIANPEQFERDPALIWGFYQHRYELYNKTLPNIGFWLLREFIQDKKDYFIVTSNVDGHFQTAGFPEEKIYEIHGRVNKYQCTKCTKTPWNANSNMKITNPKTLAFDGRLPKCPSCGALARPNIMMFNDYSYNSSISKTQEKAFNDFMYKYDSNGTKIAIIEIGAGTAIPTIRSIGEYIHSKIDSATLIRINPREAQVPQGAIGLASKGKETLLKLFDKYKDNAQKNRYLERPKIYKEKVQRVGERCTVVNGQITDDGLYDDAFDNEADKKLIKLMKHRQIIEDIETVLKERAKVK